MLQVGNIKPATEIAWFKDGIEIEEDDEDAKKIGKSDEVLTFNIGKVRLGWAMMGLFFELGFQRPYDFYNECVFARRSIICYRLCYAKNHSPL